MFAGEFVFEDEWFVVIVGRSVANAVKQGVHWAPYQSDRGVVDGGAVIAAEALPAASSASRVAGM